MCFVKVQLSVLIYLNRSSCPIYKKLHRGLSLKNSYSSILLCYPEIHYHFPSTICHPHIILEMLQSSHSLSCKYRLLQKFVQKPYALITSSKHIFQLRDACTSP